MQGRVGVSVFYIVILAHQAKDKRVYRHQAFKGDAHPESRGQRAPFAAKDVLYH